MSIENKIRLNAFNDDDLEILSFLCQDAIISKEEFFFDKTKKMFVFFLKKTSPSSIPYIIRNTRI